MADGALRSFIFGLTIAAAVGPIALLIVNYGVSRGFRSAFAAGCGAALADLLYASVAFIAGARILTWFAQNEAVLRRFSAGVLLLLGLWMVWQALRRPPNSPGPQANDSRMERGNPFTLIFLLTVVNPLTILLFVGFAGQLPLGNSIGVALFLAFTVFAGSLIVQTAFAAGGAALARILSNPNWRRALNGLSGAAIALFGLLGLST